ncbi:MAG: preprotein translocase subunit SecE [Oligoflexales bacterium]
MGKDDATWLKICYVLATILFAYTVWKAVGTIGLYTGISEKHVETFPVAASVVSIVIGLGITWSLQKDQSRNDYFLASIGELRKVTWPSMIDTRRMTIVVCVVVGIFSVILGVFDTVWGRVLKSLLP